MKVLMVSVKDQAGSGYHLTRALMSIGVEASIAVSKKHDGGYPYDHYMGGIRRRRFAAMELMHGADVIHYKGDYLPGTESLKVYNHGSPTRVITVGGSGFRRREPGLHPRVCLEWHRLSSYKSRVHGMSAITPDLMYDSDISLIPHALPERPLYIPGNKVPVIGHSPSDREKKGTDKVFVAALDMLKKEGYKFETRIIEGVDHETCMDMKRGCDIFFDQAEVPAYGMSAVEAMMTGTPLVTRMPDHVIDRDPMYSGFPGEFFEESTPESAAAALSNVLESSIEERSALTHRWANDMHSYAAVAPRLLRLYESAMNARYGDKRKVSSPVRIYRADSEPPLDKCPQCGHVL